MKVSKVHAFFSLLQILCSGGSKGGAKDTPPSPVSLIFMKFAAYILPNNRLTRIPLPGNPGFPTALVHRLGTFTIHCEKVLLFPH